MKVKILEESIKHEIDSTIQVFEKDEVRSVPDNVGEYFCGLGWAEDVSGQVKTGERSTTNRATLKVDNTNNSVEVSNG